MLRLLTSHMSQLVRAIQLSTRGGQRAVSHARMFELPRKQSHYSHGHTLCGMSRRPTNPAMSEQQVKSGHKSAHRDAYTLSRYHAIIFCQCPLGHILTAQLEHGFLLQSLGPVNLQLPARHIQTCPDILQASAVLDAGSPEQVAAVAT